MSGTLVLAIARPGQKDHHSDAGRRDKAALAGGRSMGVYDQAARYLAKQRSAGFLRWLCPQFATAFQFQGWLDTGLPTFPGEPDRICDTVAEFRAPSSDEPRRLLDAEFQTDPDTDMLERLGEYAYRLRRALRYGTGQNGKYRVLSVLISLTGSEQSAVLDMTEPLLYGAGIRQQIVVRTLREEDAAQTLAFIAAGEFERCVLLWIPLMRGGGESGILDEWKRLADQEPDGTLRADFGGLALVFAELAGHGPAWRKALEGWNVRQSQQVLEWQEEARKEGRQEGRQEGLVEQARADLLRALERRFQIPVPEDLATRIAGTSDLELIRRWFDEAITTNSFDAFCAAI
jgi:hypothetical protein